MTMFLFWILSVLAVSHGMDKTKLENAPPPMKGFHLHPSLGRWFVQFRLPPCSWSGSSEFQDYETSLTMDGTDSVLAKETIRNDVCNTITTRIYIRSPPGVFTVKDPMGNNWSGSYIIPATDYKTFSITYGCTKMSTLGDKCNDAWLSIKTRMATPGQNVITRINKVLMKLWGVTVDQLQHVKHQQSCLAPAKHHHQFSTSFGSNGLTSY